MGIARQREWTSCAAPARFYERRQHTQGLHEQYLSRLDPQAQLRYKVLLRRREELEAKLESMLPSGDGLQRCWQEKSLLHCHCQSIHRLVYAYIYAREVMFWHLTARSPDAPIPRCGCAYRLEPSGRMDNGTLPL